MAHGEVSGLWVTKLMHNEAFTRRLFFPSQSQPPTAAAAAAKKKEKRP
jgi:hypothetical protein